MENEIIFLLTDLSTSGEMGIQDGIRTEEMWNNKSKFSLMQWVHICLVVSEDFVHVFRNGILRLGYNQTRLAQDSFEITVGGKKVLNPETQTQFEEGSFVGEISNLEVWFEIIPYRDIVDVLTKCKPLSITTKDVQWSRHGEVKISSGSNRNIQCRLQSREMSIVQPSSNYLDMTMFCKALGLRIVDPSMPSEDEDVEYLLNNYNGLCFQGEKTSWVISNSQSNILGRECTTISSTKKNSGAACESHLCGICKFQRKRKTFTMRGICQKQSANLTFIAANNENSSLYFQGVDGYIVTYEDSSWKLKTYEAGKILAALEGENIIGSSNWTLKINWCNNVAGSKVLVAFNSCSAKESWCNSGSCIPAQQRCNSIRDCDDGTDEEGCVGNHAKFSKATQNTQLNITAITPQNVAVSLKVRVLRLFQTQKDGYLQAVIESSLTWTDTETMFPNIVRGEPTRLPLTLSIWKPAISPPGFTIAPDACIGEECEEPSVTVYTDSQPQLDTGNDASGGE